MINYIVLNGTEAGKSLTEDDLPSDMAAYLTNGRVLWADVTITTGESVKKLQGIFNLDPYAIEDVMTGEQRPKIEDYGEYTFSVIKVPEQDSSGATAFNMRELFIFFSKKWIITIHSERLEVVDSVSKRVRVRGLSPYSRAPSTDLIYYLLMDNAVDNFYPILYSWDDELDRLDDNAVGTVTKRGNRVETVRDIGTKFSDIRTELSVLRNTMTPTRDILSTIMKGSVPFIRTESLKNFRDIYDHTFQLIEMVDSYINRSSDIRNLYLNLMSAVTNEVLRVLTIVATIFLPLSLLASLFGTNFTSGINIPLTHLHFGFYLFVAILTAIGGTMILMFRRNGWV